VLVNSAPARDAATPWISRRVAEQPASLVGAPARLGPGPWDLARLLEAHPVILPTAESGVRAGFDALAGRLGVRTAVAAEADDMAMLRLMAREDLGLAVIPPIVVRDELASGRLAEAARLEGVSETFYAVTLARRFPNPLVGELLEAAPPLAGAGATP
jgi:LysR family transcriptional activator of nhaA